MSRLVINLLQDFVIPAFLALSPRALRRNLLKSLSHHNKLFAPEVQSMLQNLPRFLPQADLDRAAQQLRLSHLVDRSAPFHLPWAHKRILNEAFIEGPHPQPGETCLILGAHYGCAWWLLPWLARQGCPVHFVIAPQALPEHWRAWLMWPVSRWRWHCLSNAGKLPLILMHGASHAVQIALRSGGCVNALIDIPPVLAKRCSPLYLLGRKAHMPIQLVRAATLAGVPIWFSIGYWDEVHSRTVLHFVRLHGDENAVFSSYGEHLSAWLEQEPGRWHCWGHVDAFFDPPSERSAQLTHTAT